MVHQLAQDQEFACEFAAGGESGSARGEALEHLLHRLDAQGHFRAGRHAGGEGDVADGRIVGEDRGAFYDAAVRPGKFVFYGGYRVLQTQGGGVPGGDFPADCELGVGDRGAFRSETQ
jgi:hypothetical protein